MANSTPVITRATELPEPLMQDLAAILPRCMTFLPTDVVPEVFQAALFLHLHDPKSQLRDCTPESVLECTIQAAQDGLLPGRDCFFLPFNDRGRRKATYVQHYQGIIRVLERTGKVAKAFAHPVYSNDHFVVDYLTDTFSHKPALDHARSSILCYYGCVVLKDGTRHVEVLTLDEIEAVKRRAPAAEQGPWVTHPIMMSRKTALKRVEKYCQLTHQASEDEDATPLLAEAQIQAHVSDLFGGSPDQPLVIDHTASSHATLPPEPPLFPERQTPKTRPGSASVETDRDAISAIWEELPAKFRQMHESALLNPQTAPGHLQHVRRQAEALLKAQVTKQQVLDTAQQDRQPGEEGE